MKRRRALRTEIGAVKTELQNSSADTSRRLREGVRDVLRYAEAIWELFEMFDTRRQAELLSAVSEVVVLGVKGVVGYSLRRPFAALFAVAPEAASGKANDVRRLASKSLRREKNSPEVTALLPISFSIENPSAFWDTTERISESFVRVSAAQAVQSSVYFTLQSALQNTLPNMLIQYPSPPIKPCRVALNWRIARSGTRTAMPQWPQSSTK